MRQTQNRSFLTKLLKDAFTSSTNTQKLFSRSVSNQHQVKVLVKRKSPTERRMGNDPTGSCLSHPRSGLSQNNQRTSCRGRAGQVSCCQCKSCLMQPSFVSSLVVSLSVDCDKTNNNKTFETHLSSSCGFQKRQILTRTCRWARMQCFLSSTPPSPTQVELFTL